MERGETLQVDRKATSNMDVGKAGLVLLLVLWCCKLSPSERRSSRTNSRLLSMLRLRYRSLTAFTKRNQQIPGLQQNDYKRELFLEKRRRQSLDYVDVRGNKAFDSVNSFPCCPSRTVHVPMDLGIDDTGRLVELLGQEDGTKQQFFKTYCMLGRKGKPCQFIDHSFSHMSRCVQKYSYVYAIARPYQSNAEWSLKSIRTPSGCRCEIKPSG